MKEILLTVTPERSSSEKYFKKRIAVFIAMGQYVTHPNLDGSEELMIFSRLLFSMQHYITFAGLKNLNGAE